MVLNPVPRVLEDLKRALKPTAHFHKVGHVLDDDNQRADSDCAVDHALASVETFISGRALVVVSAAALALQSNCNHIGSTNGKTFHWERFVNIVRNNIHTTSCVMTAQNGGGSGANIPRPYQTKEGADKSQNFATNPCTNGKERRAFTWAVIRDVGGGTEAQALSDRGTLLRC